MAANPFVSGSKITKMAAVYNDWLRRDALAPLAMVYESLSREHGVSVSSIKRYVKYINKNGFQPKQHQPRPLAAWDTEALEFFKRLYLMIKRDVGRCTVRNAYQQTVIAAAKNGWKVGSEQSAYVHAREIHAALKLYVNGGNRALDNLFYIARDLSNLRPFQIVVGDQHRFDFWVKDDNGVYFRPECYLWLDMRTRLVYGIAFDRSYNTRTVLRALKMGVERFGKFENTYNDNGTSEKSAVADYTIEQLQQYGMRFCDEGELYRTETGAYVVEGADGKMIAVAKSRAEWKKQNRRIFANVKNAKTKPIERFFSTLEQLLADQCLPGYVAEINRSAAEEEESSRRLEWQKKSGYILTLEEFARQVVMAIDCYEHRVHGTLKHSPQEDLNHAIEKEGWQPALIEKQDLYYLFLERAYATVRGDRVTLNNKQYIGPNLTQDMVRKNRGNLTGLNRQKVELRYDPDNPDTGVWAIDPRTNEAIFLTPVTPISMLDDAAASEALEWKKRNMKVVKETYHSITAQAPLLFDPEKFKELDESRAAALASNNGADAPPAAGSAPSPEKPAISDDEFRSMVAAKIAVEPNIRERAKLVYLSPRDRYEALLSVIAKKEKISAADIAFMADFEANMTDEQAAYFASVVSMNKF
ncbi:MAG: Mu transposase C-terminal domain-containing protein [Treponema sp.]|jgi:putative transposase|nr:Mu transposase C-terminal domain-containing protein [Treponema sp.]